MLAEALTLVRTHGGALLGSRAVSAQGRACCCAPGGRHAGGGGSLFSAGPRRGPPPAGEILGAAGRHEPELACGSSRASAPKPTSCWRRSTAGSPRALTPPTSRRPRRCWRSWGDNTALHRFRCTSAPQRRSGAPQRVAANPDTQQACLQTVAWVLCGGVYVVHSIRGITALLG